MLGYITRRLLGVIPVLLMVSLIVFMLMHAAPGDPVSMLISDEASPEDRARVAAAWGLDQPVWVQYLNFLQNAVMLDFGDSFRYQQPVIDLVLERLPASLELALYATLMAVIVGIPLGIWAAARPNSIVDTLASFGGFFGISMPNFWLGIMLILIFAGQLNLLPSGGRMSWGDEIPRLTGFLTVDAVLQGRWGELRLAFVHLLLPTVVLGTAMTGIIMQLTRASMLENLAEDYVMTARAKGVRARTILWLHAFRNALVSVITIIGLEFGALLSGAIIVETIFSWPGIGQLLIQGIGARDLPLITGLVIIYTALFVLLNLLIDVLYTIVDPRIRMR